ncbi:uncharacterized protein [Parasteatoda tepidariorum]|uniref:uncharacterized protein n=1 Tax=Parasteatoda tepidariorum TaxID=114398 RepID=UPI00077FB4E9|nr:uncharacterized protein LOC107448004 isoform X2 [Parasteatoda tepidariorum]XP_015918581.1 uncharacterized protein LOC107448004 isoform X2 [Parasteatoda tepidariorum]XP_015918582.1 uncharacterized protein LOC107448004 isoform X2 [Parasteatoda tepidariorum]XP_015918583.1 uncharacterized protein LOC107448004 isoform X2 [Parasteatoda tepidariorum]XP_015918584.1 uncharacterized protein LOC107448004 isoform X2 [Parasteatoda tepidariorum]XP_042908043.1 uncharacterized protein LOC107448004 isoform 
MAIKGLIFAVCCIFSVVIADQDEKDSFRQTICNKNSDELFDDLEDCFQKYETKVSHEITAKCNTKIYPQSEGSSPIMVKQACKEWTLWKQFDDCFEEYKHLWDKMEVGEEGDKCYQAVFVKHEINVS